MNESIHIISGKGKIRGKESRSIVANASSWGRG